MLVFDLASCDEFDVELEEDSEEDEEDSDDELDEDSEEDVDELLLVVHVGGDVADDVLVLQALVQVHLLVQGRDPVVVVRVLHVDGDQLDAHQLPRLLVQPREDLPVRPLPPSHLAFEQFMTKTRPPNWFKPFHTFSLRLLVRIAFPSVAKAKRSNA